MMFKLLLSFIITVHPLQQQSQPKVLSSGLSEDDDGSQQEAEVVEVEVLSSKAVLSDIFRHGALM